MRETLLEMLTYCRPAGSRADAKFRRRFLLDLPAAFEDVYGNIHVTVGESRCLWSCHTDTVHARQGRQTVTTTGPFAHLPLTSHSSCLGADDTVGVYLLREMILNRVRGHYIFHYGEERGGIGSSELARHHADFLRKEFDCAIAVDRAGTGDIITHQGGRTCSPEFAESLGRAIGALDAGLTYKSAHGVYTDTAEYADIIPECSNLSVGYERQHTPGEYVDLRHVDRLLGVLCDLDTSQLVIARDPDAIPAKVIWPDFLWKDEWPEEPAVSADDYARMTAAERRAEWD